MLAAAAAAAELGVTGKCGDSERKGKAAGNKYKIFSGSDKILLKLLVVTVAQFGGYIKNH